LIVFVTWGGEFTLEEDLKNKKEKRMKRCNARQLRALTS